MVHVLTLVTLLITTFVVPISPQSAEPKTITIAEARSLPLGTIMTSMARDDITGFSGQFANDFEVDPRIQDDIRVIN